MTTFSLEVEVTDPAALIAAGKERAFAEHVTAEQWADWAATQSEISIALRTLLDPGSLAGCKILDSWTD